MNSMKIATNKLLAILMLSAAFLLGCEDELVDKNENPNGVSPDNVHPNLMLATVLTQSSTNVVSLGFGDIAGCYATHAEERLGRWPQ